MLQLLAYLLFEQFAFSFFEALRWIALKSLKPLASRKYYCHSQKNSVPVLSAEHLRLFFCNRHSRTQCCCSRDYSLLPDFPRLALLSDAFFFSRRLQPFPQKAAGAPELCGKCCSTLLTSDFKISKHILHFLQQLLILAHRMQLDVINTHPSSYFILLAQATT